ncbi:iron ABC transporter permease [bacterium SCSIO 12827]|nr:iron ABC transporter permease [bacterium SCSIO 12827]
MTSSASLLPSSAAGGRGISSGLAVAALRKIRHERGKALLLAGCVAVLGYFLIYPFSLMLVRGIQDPVTGALTLSVYEAMITDPAFYAAFQSSLIISLGTLAVCVVLAVPMAWGVSRSDMPYRGTIRVLTMLTFATPSFLGAIAWILLLGPGGGELNLFIRWLFDLESSPFNIFGTGGIIFVFSLYLYPYVFFAVCTALDNIDPAMEEAAAMLGASKLRTTFTVTLPLVLPAVLAGGALVFLESTVNFGVPAIVGLPVHVETLTTRIYSLFQFPPQYEMAAATAVPIILIVGLCVLIQRMAIGNRTYVTVGGISGRRDRVRLGRLGWVLSGLSFTVIAASILLPFLALLVTSLKRTFGNPVGFDNLTLQHFKNVLLGSTAQDAILNSLILAAGAATVCMVLAVIAAWLVERTKLPGRGLLTLLVMACFSFPGVALAVALIYAFSNGPLVLYGTMWILLLSYSIHGLPVVFNYARIGLRQVNPELSDAAEILGASWHRAFRDITVPLIKSGIISGGLIVFVLMMREFGSSVLLSGGGTEVVAVIIYEFAEEGDNGRMAALSLIVFVVNLIVVAAAHHLRRAWSDPDNS